jgi:hypothetical protein
MTRFAYLRTALASRRIRRAAIFMFLLAAMLKAMAVPVAASPAIWSVKLARYSQNCQRGLGICINPFGPLDGTAATSVSFEVARRGVVGGIDSQGHLAFLSPLHEEGDTLFVERDVLLDRRRSLELGYQSVTIVAGAYPITRTSDNPNGEVVVALRTIGITITIDIGRKSQGCTRFGACSITIGAELMNRPAGGSASINGNRLGWDAFLEIEAEEDSSVMYVDEDIELDAATSLALGAKRVIVKKGAYPVDYSENPNGHVEFDVQRIGITIVVDFGRKIYNCERGFGVCSVTIDIDLRVGSDHATPTVASLDGSQLTLDLLARSKRSEAELTLDAAYQLEPAVAKALGRRSITLLPGTYAVDYRSNPNGTVVIPVATQGIGVTIWFGRSWYNCRGVGICRIDINTAKTSTQQYTAIGHYSDGVTRMMFTEATGAGDTALTIDDDIVLDGATAQGLGAERLTIKRGTYPIDYSTNPYGDVSLLTSVDGAASVDREQRTEIVLASYPNPASDRSTVRFTADGANKITLDLLDAHGSVVMTLVDGERLERGEHERTFTVASLPAGAYFQRLSTGAATTIRAMQVVR